MNGISIKKVVLLSLIGAIAVIAPTAYYIWDVRKKSEEIERQVLPPLLVELKDRYGGVKYSEHSEELIIRDFFQDRRDGFFLDVGAYHYRDKSNTYLLESELGWSGIAVEPQLKFQEDYVRYRPRTQFVGMFVSDTSDEEVAFFVPQGKDTRASADERVRNWNPGSDETKVLTITLNDLLEKYEVEKVDFLTMDIELWEPKALAGFDIEKYRPELVCIEAHKPVRSEIEAYFAAHNYVLLKKYLEIDSLNYYYTPAGGS